MELLLNTDNIDWETFEDTLGHLTEDEIRKPRGKVVGFVPISKRSSHYGSICNNGATGHGRFTRDLYWGIMGAASSSDRITVHKDDNNDLVVQYHDHDGTHITTWKTITKSLIDKYLYLNDYGTHEEMIEFLEKRPSIKLQ